MNRTCQVAATLSIFPISIIGIFLVNGRVTGRRDPARARLRRLPACAAAHALISWSVPAGRHGLAAWPEAPDEQVYLAAKGQAAWVPEACPAGGRQLLSSKTTQLVDNSAGERRCREAGHRVRAGRHRSPVPGRPMRAGSPYRTPHQWGHHEQHVNGCPALRRRVARTPQARGQPVRGSGGPLATAGARAQLPRLHGGDPVRPYRPGAAGLPGHRRRRLRRAGRGH
jgi:hypothetical protein